MTGAFTGMVFAVQTYLQFHKVKMDTAVGPVVSVADDDVRPDSPESSSSS